MGKNISYLLLLYNKNTEKRNLLQLKCKRFLKLMTLRIIEDIKSVIEKDPTLPQYIDGDLTFRFLSDYRILLKYQFGCNDENEAEAESFSKSCVEDIRKGLEEKGYRIERIDCTAKEMDMKWLDELEDMVFPKNPSL